MDTPSIDFVGRKQNKITVEGKKYKAKEVISGCTGCAFRGLLCPCLPNTRNSLCASLERTDGKSVVWLLHKEAPDA